MFPQKVFLVLVTQYTHTIPIGRPCDDSAQHYQVSSQVFIRKAPFRDSTNPDSSSSIKRPRSALVEYLSIVVVILTKSHFGQPVGTNSSVCACLSSTPGLAGYTSLYSLFTHSTSVVTHTKLHPIRYVYQYFTPFIAYLISKLLGFFVYFYISHYSLYHANKLVQNYHSTRG